MLLLRESERDIPLPTFSASKEDLEFDRANIVLARVPMPGRCWQASLCGLTSWPGAADGEYAKSLRQPWMRLVHKNT